MQSSNSPLERIIQQGARLVFLVCPPNEVQYSESSWKIISEKQRLVLSKVHLIVTKPFQHHFQIGILVLASNVKVFMLYFASCEFRWRSCWPFALRWLSIWSCCKIFSAWRDPRNRICLICLPAFCTLMLTATQTWLFCWRNFRCIVLSANGGCPIPSSLANSFFISWGMQFPSDQISGGFTQTALSWTRLGQMFFNTFCNAFMSCSLDFSATVVVISSKQGENCFTFNAFFPQHNNRQILKWY